MCYELPETTCERCIVVTCVDRKRSCTTTV